MGETWPRGTSPAGRAPIPGVGVHPMSSYPATDIARHVTGEDLRLIAAVVAMALVVGVAAACGGDDRTTADPITTATAPATSTTTETQATTTTPATTTAAAPDATAATTTTEAPTTTAAVPATTTTRARSIEISDDVPDIEMFDAATGELVSLRSVVKGQKPLMFWFWSPF